MRPEIEWWIRAAERDLASARQLLQGSIFEGVAFHCQQAAEKLLKGLVLARGGGSQRTHSCVRLVRALEKLGLQIPPDVATACRKLDPHYVDARYPNGVGGAPEEFYDETIAGESLRYCEAIGEFVRGHLA